MFATIKTNGATTIAIHIPHDEAEAFQDYMERVWDDATDAVLADDGNTHWLLGDDARCDKALMAVLDLTDQAPLNVRVQELREALRAAATKMLDDAIRAKCEQMAECAAEEAREDAAWARIQDRAQEAAL